MTSLAVAVVTTAGREQYLEATLGSVADARVHVVKDAAKGLTPNHLAAWRQLTTHGTTHCLLLQDDVLAARGWRTAATLLVERFPDCPVSLYSARKATADQAARGRGYARLSIREWLNEQALILPTPVVEDYLDWVRARKYRAVITSAQFKHHDVILRAFLATTGAAKSVVLAAPAVVQHIGEESTVGNPWKVGGRTRQAQDWPGADWDAAAHFLAALTIERGQSQL